ncbi:hypothetical protein [Pedobacter sp. SYP-B3415]|uniref:hypothetical protein n=1 Tax=Pedobacter sp. SYP-B3415 TaxID=2496641 RepID=UPI00101C3A5E|nr:hypothetical protein [Pedobacter sp. SYP-B3415]
METNEQNFEQEEPLKEGETNESPENASDLAGVASGNMDDPSEEEGEDSPERTEVPEPNPGSTNGPQGDHSDEFDPNELNTDRNGDDRHK